VIRRSRKNAWSAERHSAASTPETTVNR